MELIISNSIDLEIIEMLVDMEIQIREEDNRESV